VAIAQSKMLEHLIEHFEASRQEKTENAAIMARGRRKSRGIIVKINLSNFLKRL
jgi:hypothetical protein